MSSFLPPASLLPLSLVGLVSLMLFWKPIKQVLKLLLRTAFGAGLLAILSVAPPFLGLGVNPWNAAILGLLGAPGVGLLLLVRWIATG